jgi:uncharacterized protein (TIGR01777 family)
MKIIITGASGLIGSALIPRLLADGHDVTRFVRDAAATRTTAESRGVRSVGWNIDKEIINDAEIAAHDAVIHLAGEPVAEGRWTTEKKQRIRDSRVTGTRLIANSIARVEARPRVFISASAIGFYGNRGDEILDEQSAPGADFLAGVCREWEAAADAAREAGVRTVHPRIGIVLSKEGGALAKLLTPFRLGAGGALGDGKQFMSWIAIDDIIDALAFSLENESVADAINFVAPHPVTNAQFTHALGHALNRPTLFTVPKFAARIAFGELADAALLASARVMPKRLQAAGYEFKFPLLEAALRHLLD